MGLVGVLAVAGLLLRPAGSGAAAPASAHRADRAPCRVHVILFVPSDVKPPAGYQQRVDQIVDYTESFFQRQLTRWGHEKVVMPFHRSEDGWVPVAVIRGREKAASYKPVAVRVEVMDALRGQNRIDAKALQIWWILVYAGEPPAKFAGFLGGFGPQIGGWAVCNFNTTPERIDPAAPLGSDFLERIALKGMIHELGHGFGLPHVGPLKRDDAGNTLMGPTHFNYRRVTKVDEPRAYLSEAEAAMFATHPAFRGAPHDHGGPLPKVDVQDVKYAADPKNKTLVVRGRVRGSRRAVYALVADESDARPGEYWTKTYAGKVGADGTFEVVVSEPSESNGTLRTWFAFEGGAMTGDGKARGRESGVAKAYTYGGKRWTFE
jgi:hypothetical protein